MSPPPRLTLACIYRVPQQLEPGTSCPGVTLLNHYPTLTVFQQLSPHKRFINY